PAFETLRPFGVFAADAKAAGQLAASPTGAPLRMAFVYFPNGAIPANWWPNGEGKDFELNRTKQPLQNVKERLQILGGLAHVNSKIALSAVRNNSEASWTLCSMMPAPCRASLLRGTGKNSTSIWEACAKLKSASNTRNDSTRCPTPQSRRPPGSRRALMSIFRSCTI